MADDDYIPPSERDRGLRVGDSLELGIEVAQLNDSINFPDNETYTSARVPELY
jgi:hypothetical protein